MTETINATTDLQREKGENKLTPAEKKEIQMKYVNIKEKKDRNRQTVQVI